MGVWFIKLIEGPEQSENTCLKKALKAIFVCHVCLQLAVLVVMVGLFCGLQTLEFPAIFWCTQGNITLSSKHQFPASNMICNDLRYKEKSKLNTSIIVIMSVSIFLCILTILHLVVTREEFFIQLIGNITGRNREQSLRLIVRKYANS